MVNLGQTVGNGDTMSLVQDKGGVLLVQLKAASQPTPVTSGTLMQIADGNGVVRATFDANGGMTTSGAISAAGVTMTGAGIVTQNVIPASGVSTTLSTGNTVTPTASIMRFTNGGAITGVIIAVGTVDGQTFTLVNEGSGTITFAAVATSHVADGTTTPIPVLTARTFVWMANTVQAAWYRTSG